MINGYSLPILKLGFFPSSLSSRSFCPISEGEFVFYLLICSYVLWSHQVCLLSLLVCFVRGFGKHFYSFCFSSTQCYFSFYSSLLTMEDLTNNLSELSLFDREHAGFVLPKIHKSGEYIIVAKFLIKHCFGFRFMILQKAFGKPLERSEGHLNPQMMMEVTSFGNISQWILLFLYAEVGCSSLRMGRNHGFVFSMRGMVV